MQQNLHANTPLKYLHSVFCVSAPSTVHHVESWFHFLITEANADDTVPGLYFPFLRGEFMEQTGIIGNGQRKSLCSFFKVVTKSSIRAALVRSLHNQPISSKPS